jgi:asparagine synthase (glutamine-hydrolysing)
MADRMAAAVAHRGPDDSGTWSDPDGIVGLGSRRLAIIDLSPEGRQPMSSADGRYTVAYNGEIYNFATLRVELAAAGFSFRGHSDTEILLAALSHWGVEAAIPRLWGMFAFAVWDASERQLHLVRDRLGKKPLYYGWQDETLLFGSELKALRTYPSFRPPIDRSAIASYLRFSYIPAPQTIYVGVLKLPPATWATFRADRPGERPEPRRYWDPVAITEAGQHHRSTQPDEAAVDDLESLLIDAVRLRMISDVPIGAFLSGGIDSSVVVALMQAQSSQPIRTFTIGYEAAEYDESAQAAAVAAHLGTNHTELRLASDQMRDVIPKLPAIYDEPFADASQIPTFLVSTLARRSVTVALSGDGGDEVFGGYNRYVTGMRTWRRLSTVPLPVRKRAARTIERIPPRTWDHVGQAMDRFLPARSRGQLTGNRIHKLASVLGLNGIDELYTRLVSTWPSPDALVREGAEPAVPWSTIQSGLAAPAERMMLFDLVSYLPDDILVKVDRASMAASLEARAPLLDHRVIEFASRLPLGQRIRGAEGKWILRRVLDRYVPGALVERPKRGFGVPIDAWLRGPLRAWATDLLSPARLDREGFLVSAPIAAALREHLAGRRNLQYQLWAVLMFEAWLDSQVQSAVAG